MEEPKALPPRVVNVNEWLDKRGVEIELPTLAEVYEQAKLQEQWLKHHEEMERTGQLDLKSKECVECMSVVRHYKDDYMCYRCRDALDSQ